MIGEVLRSSWALSTVRHQQSLRPLADPVTCWQDRGPALKELSAMKLVVSLPPHPRP